MSNEANKIASIKERFLQVADFYGVAKESFFEGMGLSYGNFRGKAKNTPINSDAIATLIASYNALNPMWVISGVGDMILRQTNFYETPTPLNLTKRLVSGQFVFVKEKSKVQFAPYFFLNANDAFFSVIEPMQYSVVNQAGESDTFKKNRSIDLQFKDIDHVLDIAAASQLLLNNQSLPSTIDIDFKEKYYSILEKYNACLETTTLLNKKFELNDDNINYQIKKIT